MSMSMSMSKEIIKLEWQGEQQIETLAQPRPRSRPDATQPGEYALPNRRSPDQSQQLSTP